MPKHYYSEFCYVTEKETQDLEELIAIKKKVKSKDVSQTNRNSHSCAEECFFTMGPGGADQTGRDSRLSCLI